jgi:hypothetical protein
MAGRLKVRHMLDEVIAEIGVDDQGALYVRPEQSSFPLIYRAGAEIGWDASRARLFSAAARQWSYARWLSQIVEAVVDEYGVRLRLATSTSWTNVPEDLRAEIASEIA